MAFESQADDFTWIQSYKDNTDYVSFLDFPRELRDHIYDYALRAPGAIFVFTAEMYYSQPKIMAKIIKYKNEGPSEPQPVKTIIPVALLRSCRQLHVECSAMLYGSNIFRMYMIDMGFAPAYRSLVRHITFTTGADSRIFGSDLDTVGYWWKKRFWPDILSRSTRLLDEFPNLQSITFPIKSNNLNQTWRPAPLAFDNKTRQQRIERAALWMKAKCPIENDRLRNCLHLEVMEPTSTSKNEPKSSPLFPYRDDDWDSSEFADAFERMKAL